MPFLRRSISRLTAGLRRYSALGFALLAFFALSAPSHAYEEDTHFLLTYVLCRSVGFTASEALTVAAADQGMDDSQGTIADQTGFHIPNVVNEWMWHAFDYNGTMGPSGIISHKDQLFEVAKARPTPEEKLKYLGIFFHNQQDTWAHRHHYDGDPHTYDKFTTYNTPLGHSLDGHQPDRPPFDPVTAIMDLEDGVTYAKAFLKDALGRQPTALLANYHSLGGTQDDAWTDPKKSVYFHQLAAAGAPGSAQKFLTDLIRAQINAYPASQDYTTTFTPPKKPDELDFDKARAAFQSVCDSDEPSLKITLPTKQDKLDQHFTDLKTSTLMLASTRSITFKNNSSNYIAIMTVKYGYFDIHGAKATATKATPVTSPGAMNTIEVPTAVDPSVIITVQLDEVKFLPYPPSAKWIVTWTVPNDFKGGLTYHCAGTSASPYGGFGL